MVRTAETLVNTELTVFLREKNNFHAGIGVVHQRFAPDLLSLSGADQGNNHPRRGWSITGNRRRAFEG
jgi:hypothetical protein